MSTENIVEKYLPKKTEFQVHGNLITYQIPVEKIVKTCVELYRQHQLSLKIITAFDERENSGSFKIMYIFGIPKENVFLAPYITTKEDFPSLTPSIHEASLYERKIKSFFGLDPKGHPKPNSLILHENWPENLYPLRKDFNYKTRPADANGKYNFQKVQGEGIYEIPVGPVHAGIIEPGHFRFSVAGEEIVLLEPRLGYSHKGSEKLFEVLSLQEKVKLSERISGDSSFSHSLAFCQALESLSDTVVPEKAKYLRVIFAELERLANHFGDIGAIMTDTGFNFGGANGARLREMVMQINERLTDSRFLRGVNIFGGVSKDIKSVTAKKLIQEIESLIKDFSEVIGIANDSSSLLNRLKDTGTLDVQLAKDHGVIGVAGRAMGFANDARIDYPYAAYNKFNFEIATEKSCDVYARFLVRIKEVYTSATILKKALSGLPQNDQICNPQPNSFRKNSYTVSIVEGWRGDIVYLVSSDAVGNISRVAVRDPSFLNWSALGAAGRGNMVPDFPLINKSFNLSYSGNDL